MSFNSRWRTPPPTVICCPCNQQPILEAAELKLDFLCMFHQEPQGGWALCTWRSSWNTYTCVHLLTDKVLGFDSPANKRVLKKHCYKPTHQQENLMIHAFVSNEWGLTLALSVENRYLRWIWCVTPCLTPLKDILAIEVFRLNCVWIKWWRPKHLTGCLHQKPVLGPGMEVLPHERE